MLVRLFPSISPSAFHLTLGYESKIMETTYSRYTVNPTAAPISAALNAVEMTDPVMPFRRFDGGRSIRFEQ